MYRIDRSSGDFAINASEMRHQHLTTEIDDSASTDNVPASCTKSQSQYQPRTEKRRLLMSRLRSWMTLLASWRELLKRWSIMRNFRLL